MKHDLEALLFASDTPLGAARLKSILEVGGAEIREAIEALNADYSEQGRSFSIMELGGGWQLVTRPEYSPLIRKLYREKRFVRLSKAALEVLAIIAYRQPVTRIEIEEIRGVQVSSVLGTLSERNLITVVGRSDSLGNPILYGTTREFLNYMGLKGLHQLPALPDLKGIIEDREDIKDFAQKVGAEIQDDVFETIAVRGDEVIVVDPREADEPPAPEDASGTGSDATITQAEEAASEAPAGEGPAEDEQGRQEERA